MFRRWVLQRRRARWSSARGCRCRTESPTARRCAAYCHPTAQRAEEHAVARRERVDRAVAEIADQQRAAKLAEAVRRDGDSPRRIQHAARRDAANQPAVGIEHTHIAETGTVYLFIAVLGLLGVRHVDVAIDRLNAERREFDGTNLSTKRVAGRSTFVNVPSNTSTRRCRKLAAYSKCVVPLPLSASPL